jgi:ABC-2 type transport system permease protein
VTRLVRAELLKLFTTRTFYVLLGVALLVSGLTAGIVAAEEGLNDDPALELAEVVSFSGFLALVIGILLTTNEYRHGTIASTFLVTPQRPRVLAAKLLAGGLAGAAFGLAVAALAVGIAVPWLEGTADEISFDSQLLEAVGRLLAMYALFALVGVAVGAVVQNQAGAIVATFGWIFVIEQIVNVVAGILADGDSPVAPYLLGSALFAVVAAGGDDTALHAGWALVLSCGYVAVLALAGAAAMVRRDPA